ncbi:MAG: ABC-2 transporter permease [Oscillospiraceae bacterium]|nr:ABC-2 transporter permease [Oscillospiraceae bacterium]
MKAIFRRELRAYFTGGYGWVFCGAFSLLAGLLYFALSISQYQSDFRHVFSNMLVAMIFLIPLVTMRIWSEEKKQKTDQLLLTAPINVGEIVLGKFFAALMLFLIALCVTLIYPILTHAFGTLDVGVTVGNYIAIILAAAAYIAVSQFMSSLSESQIISALLSMLTLSAFYFLDLIFQATTSEVLSGISRFLSIITRYRDFSGGVFSLSDAIYFVSLTVLFLFFTTRVIEKRRWS